MNTNTTIKLPQKLIKRLVQVYSIYKLEPRYICLGDQVEFSSPTHKEEDSF
jgi:hypothetical protein